MNTTSALTTKESARLIELERTIKSTSGAFVACGKALAEIRDSKLYRVRFRTFEAYCESKWKMSSRHALRLMQSAELVTHGSQNESQVPQNERQLREISKVPTERRKEVLHRASLNGLTAAAIKKAAAKAEPNVVRDDSGYPIPPLALPFWERREEMEEIARLISKARSAVRNLPVDDPMLVEVNLNSVLSDLNNAYTTFKQAVPTQVCGTCQGRAPQTCLVCKGRGVISEFKWKTAIPEEIKAMRAGSIQK